MNLAAAVLQDAHVRLEPLAEPHREGLRAAAEADQEIWSVYPYSMAGEHFAPYWERTQKAMAKGLVLAHAVLRGDEVVGVSCYFPDPPNNATEIGGTYFRPDVRGGAVNPACKRLMMIHAYDSGATRVTFRVDALNARSRAAVLKLGAVQEGVLRADRVTWTGRVRDTVIFSVLKDEWPAVRERLDARLAVFA